MNHTPEPHALKMTYAQKFLAAMYAAADYTSDEQAIAFEEFDGEGE